MKTPLILLLIHLVCLSNAEFLKQVVDNVFTNQTVITRLNDSLILRQTFAFDELVDKWTFANSDGIVSRIYANQALNQSFSSMFQCQPAINDCKRLIAERSNISFVGEYYRYSDSTDNVKNTMTTFRVSLYEGPLRIECLSSGACRYNATSRVLTIRESLTHNLSSVVRVTRFSDHELPIEIFYKSTPMREECLLNENRRVSVAKIGPKLEVTELAKNCSMAFSRSDRAITLGLRYVHGVNANGEIETMDVALDVQYGPERVALASAELNPTFIVGDSRTLKCPFVGAPIAYYWKILESKDTTEFSGTRELTLPRNLAAGTYKYQCRAHVGGFVGNTTEMVMFTVTVNSVLYADKKKYNLMSDAASNLHTQNLSYFKNLGGIIGGIVGGVVGLIVVVLLIAVIIKCRKAVPQDENDKAKDKKNKKKANGAGAKPIYTEPKDGTEAELNPLNETTMSSKSHNDDDKEMAVDPLTSGQRTPKLVVEDSPKSVSHHNVNRSNENNSTALSSFGKRIYSPSTAEARINDAAAPNNNRPKSAYSKPVIENIGGYKVLPDEKPIKLNVI